MQKLLKIVKNNYNVLLNIILTVIVVFVLVQNNQLRARLDLFSVKTLIGEKIARLVVRKNVSRVKEEVTFPRPNKVLLFFLSETCSFCSSSRATIDFIRSQNNNRDKYLEIYNQLGYTDSVKNRDYVYLINWGENSDSRILKPSMVPTSIIINEKGAIIFQHTGLIDQKVQNKIAQKMEWK